MRTSGGDEHNAASLLQQRLAGRLVYKSPAASENLSCGDSSLLLKTKPVFRLRQAYAKRLVAATPSKAKVDGSGTAW